MCIKTMLTGFFAPVLAGSLLLVASCDSGINSTAEQNLNNLPEDNVEEIAQLAVKPPIPGVDVPYVTYSVPVSKGMTIETETGTTIEIPADAFVDKDGQVVTGKVDIKFREFHDATDIIASGIPMHNPETGEYMETAGMFEIKGQCNGQDVFVKGDKEIQVNLASFNEGDKFNFYELGAKDCRWQDKGTASPQPNTKKEARLAQLDKELSRKPLRPRKQSNVENYVFDLEVNYSRFPELKPFKGVIWEYAGEGKDPEKNEWIFNENWDEIILSKSASTGYFELLLSDGKKEFTTLVRPVLDDENYEEALALFTQTSMKEYDKIKAAQVAERDRLAVQANLTRGFGLKGFGIYNWDIWHQPGRTRCVAKPKFDAVANVNTDVNKKIAFFLVTGGKRSVVNYTAATLAMFSFNPNDKNALIAVLPEGKVAIFSAEDFQKLDLDEIESDQKALLEMATATMSIKSLGDLDAVINRAMLG